MTIREATLDDQEVILELAYEFITTTVIGRVTGCTTEALCALLAAVHRIGVIYLAQDGHHYLGMIAVVALPHPFNGQTFAEEVAWFVRPEHRDGTAGPRLLQAAKEWARQHNCWCLKMGAPADQPQVGTFYERQGFEAVETAYIKRF